MVDSVTSPTYRTTPRRRPAALMAALLPLLCIALTVGAAAAPRATAAPSLHSLQQEARRARAEMETLQAELQKVGDDLRAAQVRLDAANRELQLARRRLARAENDLELQREILAARAAALYKSGGFDWLDILSSIRSLADIDTFHALQRAIADQDRRAENESERLAREARRLERSVEADLSGVEEAGDIGEEDGDEVGAARARGPENQREHGTDRKMERQKDPDRQGVGAFSVPHVSVRFGPKRRVGRDKGSGVFVRRAAKVADESEGSCRTRIPCVPRRGVGSPSEDTMKDPGRCVKLQVLTLYQELNHDSGPERRL